MHRIVGVLSALCAVTPLFPAPAAGKPEPPKVMLWSWFAGDDFRYLKGTDVGVAYLALSIQLAGRDRPTPNPRFTAIRIPPQVWETAVVRLDFDPAGPRRPAFTDQQRKLVADMIVEIAELSHAPGIQIDFDAPRSAYPFYHRLLSELRERLAPNTYLSITTLVSWCDSPQSWLRALPVDEVVPMAFYMGQATPAITTMLQRGGQFGFPACQGSIGVWFEEQTPVRPHRNQRAYFFNNQAWSSESVKAARSRILP